MKRSKSHHRRHKHRHHGKLKEGAPPTDPHAPEDLAPMPASDPANAVNLISLVEDSTKSTRMQIAIPQQTSDLNSANFLQFNIKSSKHEFIRFHEDALSMVIYSTYVNSTYNAAGATDEDKAQRHALRSKASKPDMMWDPSVAGTSMIQSVDVAINNVNCNTNALVCPHLLQYTRMNSIFREKPAPYIATDLDFKVDSQKEAAALAMEPFDYGAFNSVHGKRVKCPLSGIFPFGMFNATRESVDRKTHDIKYFPPDTSISIRVNLWQNKLVGIFHSNVMSLKDKYFEDATVNDPPGDIRFTIQDVSLEYEVCTLKEEAYLRVMNAYRQKVYGTMNYDIIRTQHQPIMPNQSFGVHKFNLPAECRMVYLLCLNDWASFFMESKKKPISGFTRFPPNSTKIQVSFSADHGNVMEEFINFGVPGRDGEVSKKVYYEYLKHRRMFGGHFHEMFPAPVRLANGQMIIPTSLVQPFIFDLEDKKSNKTEEMTVTVYYGAEQSEANVQFVCLTVHTNGLAKFKLIGDAQYNWQWSFDNPM